MSADENGTAAVGEKLNDKTAATPLVVVVGETASGKSALAMALAKQFNGEIICADSWTVYKDFNIGTAKPTPQEQQMVAHHLLDVADPHHGFSAATYKRMALAAIKDIASRNKLPILAGGTGLYIDSVLFNYSFLPPASGGMRQALTNMSVQELLEKLQNANIDTTGIDLRNKRRLVRLIETDGQRPGREALRPNTLIIGLQISRDQLRKRIESRVDAMLAAGLESEVGILAARYGWNAEPMKGIGYREFQEQLNGRQSSVQTRERIVAATLNLAKRQRTWFQRNKSIHWVGHQAEAVELVTTFLNK